MSHEPDPHPHTAPEPSTPAHAAEKKLVSRWSGWLLALMLAWLGRRDDDDAIARAGGWIEAAVARAIADGSALTRDLGGPAGTTAAADAVLTALDAVVGAA